MAGESVSGHWLYAFLRRCPKSSQAFLVIVNFHGTESMRGAKIRIPEDARMFLVRSSVETYTFTDRLDSSWSGIASREQLENEGLTLPDLPPCSALFLEIG
jgi:hypothetical protein